MTNRTAARKLSPVQVRVLDYLIALADRADGDPVPDSPTRTGPARTRAEDVLVERGLVTRDDSHVYRPVTVTAAGREYAAR